MNSTKKSWIKSRVTTIIILLVLAQIIFIVGKPSSANFPNPDPDFNIGDTVFALPAEIIFEITHPFPYEEPYGFNYHEATIEKVGKNQSTVKTPKGKLEKIDNKFIIKPDYQAGVKVGDQVILTKNLGWTPFRFRHGIIITDNEEGEYGIYAPWLMEIDLENIDEKHVATIPRNEFSLVDSQWALGSVLGCKSKGEYEAYQVIKEGEKSVLAIRYHHIRSFKKSDCISSFF